MQGLWPGGRGSWVPNKDFAGGLRPLGEAAHQKGLKFLLWFDPEGVDPGSVHRKGTSSMGSSSTEGRQVGRYSFDLVTLRRRNG